MSKSPPRRSSSPTKPDALPSTADKDMKDISSSPVSQNVPSVNGNEPSSPSKMEAVVETSVTAQVEEAPKVVDNTTSSAEKMERPKKTVDRQKVD
jgi:hypothetical protein